MNIRTAVMLACIPLLVGAQTTSTPPASIAPDPTIILPTLVGAGPVFNQIGTPRVNLSVWAMYPIVSSAGVYTSVNTDITPVQKVDPGTGRTYYAFTASVLPGVDKVLYQVKNWTLLVGGAAGVGFNQASPSGVAVSFAGAFNSKVIYQFHPKVGAAFVLKGMYVNSSWNLMPGLSVVFRP